MSSRQRQQLQKQQHRARFCARQGSDCTFLCSDSSFTSQAPISNADSPNASAINAPSSPLPKFKLSPSTGRVSTKGICRSNKLHFASLTSSGRGGASHPHLLHAPITAAALATPARSASSSSAAAQQLLLPGARWLLARVGAGTAEPAAEARTCIRRSSVLRGSPPLLLHQQSTQRPAPGSSTSRADPAGAAAVAARSLVSVTGARSAAAAAVPAQASRTPEVKEKDPWNCAKLLFSGAMTAVVSRTCVAPLERIKMELVLKQNTGSALSTASEVWRTEGVAGFWRGNFVNILRTAPFKAIIFLSFDMYHKMLVRIAGEECNAARFAAGACAGMTATLACFPLDVARTRLLAKGGGPRYGGPFKTIAGIARHEGTGALYAGCLPALIGMAPAGAIFYGLFDMLKHQHLGRMATKRAASPFPHSAEPLQLETHWTLIYGALAGVCSELVVYPLEVVRRRIQVQSMAMAAARQSMRHPSALTVGAAAAVALNRVGPHHAAAAARGLKGISQTCAEIWRSEGARGFYSGMVPNMIQVLPASALSYYTYDSLKRMLKAEA